MPMIAPTPKPYRKCPGGGGGGIFETYEIEDKKFATGKDVGFGQQIMPCFSYRYEYNLCSAKWNICKQTGEKLTFCYPQSGTHNLASNTLW